ncbi:MAG TPA: tyrosine-protein phosphatase [Pyrinomonadaceae bacterium]
MKNIISPRLLSFATLALTLTISAVSYGQENTDKVSTVKIKNFGQMDDRFYRGAQPKENDYSSLAALGIRTVVDLRDDSPPYERAAVEAAGMRYVNIPMDDKSYPKEDQIQAFLKLVNDPKTGKFFVHCAGGRHRTGVMGAVYRFTFDHWNFDQVYTEMKKYDFYTAWGHGPMKKYVEDYWSHLQSSSATIPVVIVGGEK